MRQTDNLPVVEPREHPCAEFFANERTFCGSSRARRVSPLVHRSVPTAHEGDERERRLEGRLFPQRAPYPPCNRRVVRPSPFVRRRFCRASVLTRRSVLN